MPHRARDGLSKTEAGTPRKNLHNACVALRDHPELKGRIAYDEFRGAAWVRAQLPWDARADRAWSDFDDLAATDWLQSSAAGILVGSGIVREAVQGVAYENRFHPILEWLEGLEWDGVGRLSEWLTTYMGVPKSPLTDAVGRKFLISAVARIMRPGVKADHMLILEGSQGILKSKSLRALVGDDWFTDQIADLGTKDSSQDLRGVWIVEISELSAIRPGEVEKVKAYVSRQIDHYRPSYGRRSIDVPRQCVFIGTTNAREYLSDSTGGRRFWPVSCTNLDIEAITRDRDQLWAEAAAAFHAGANWWLDDEELRRAAEAVQEARRIADPWESIVADWLDNPTTQPDREGHRSSVMLEDGCVTVAQILQHAIGKPAERLCTTDQMRVGRILRLFGWQKKHTRTGSRWWIPEGVHAEEVVTPGVHAETGRNSGSSDTVNTVNTRRGRAYKEEVQNLQTGGHGGHGIHINGSAWPDAPSIGTVEDGWRYIGGDPAQPSSWEAVS